MFPVVLSLYASGSQRIDVGAGGAGRGAGGAPATGGGTGGAGGVFDGSGPGACRFVRTRFGTATIGRPSANVLVSTVTPPRKSARHSGVSVAFAGRRPA